MKYLENIGFSAEEMEQVKNNNQELTMNELEKQEKIVSSNIDYLKQLGVTNYKELFINYSEFFLQENSVFEKIFSKYDREDLIEKLKKNPAIMIRL